MGFIVIYRPGNTLLGIGIYGVYGVKIWEEGGKMDRKRELDIYSGFWVYKIISGNRDSGVKYGWKGLGVEGWTSAECQLSISGYIPGEREHLIHSKIYR